MNQAIDSPCVNRYCNNTSINLGPVIINVLNRALGLVVDVV